MLFLKNSYKHEQFNIIMSSLLIIPIKAEF